MAMILINYLQPNQHTDTWNPVNMWLSRLKLRGEPLISSHSAMAEDPESVALLAEEAEQRPRPAKLKILQARIYTWSTTPHLVLKNFLASHVPLRAWIQKTGQSAFPGAYPIILTHRQKNITQLGTQK